MYLRTALRRLRKTQLVASESGQAMIELFLTMPLLLLVLGGAIELAHIAYAAIVVTNAAKSAVQYGAQDATTAPDVEGMKRVAGLDAVNLPPSANFTTTVNPSSCVCKKTTGTTNIGCADTCTGGHIIETLSVTTNATMSPLFNFPMFRNKTFNLTSTVKQEVLY